MDHGEQTERKIESERENTRGFQIKLCQHEDKTTIEVPPPKLEVESRHHRVLLHAIP